MLIQLDARLLGERQSAFDHLQQKLDLSAECGRNLDALYDVLTERGTQTHVAVRHAAGAEGFAAAVISTLRDAARDNPALTVQVLRDDAGMEYRPLGSTGLLVSEIGLGCEGFAKEDCAMTAPLLDRAQELGVNYFDLYTSNPKVRAAVGRALQGRREEFLIQSHIGSVWQNGQYKRTRDLAEVQAGFEEMMTLLQTDWLDVGMIHYCDSMQDWQQIVSGGLLEYALELKRQGRIRHVGLSSHNPEVALAAVRSGHIEVLMFSVNPCYDLLPANEDVEQLWNGENYKHHLVNMDPQRQELYQECQRLGVGVTVMKAFGGGDLLSAELSPAGAALTAHQCIHYALTRPGVATVLAGAHSVEQLEDSARYEQLPAAQRDYAAAFAAFPNISWKGHCMYCSHCAPCPVQLDVASITKFLNLALAQGEVPETVREHYNLLGHYAGACIRCGLCEFRCPFHVPIRENMAKAAEIFGK